MSLSNEERQKLYEEEKAREEIREQLRGERREGERSDEVPSAAVPLIWCQTFSILAL